MTGRRRSRWTVVATALLLATCTTPKPLFRVERPGREPAELDEVALLPRAVRVRPGDAVALPLRGGGRLPADVVRVQSGLRYRISIEGSVRGGGRFWVGDRWGDVEGFVESRAVSYQFDPIGAGRALVGPRRFLPVTRGGAWIAALADGTPGQPKDSGAGVGGDPQTTEGEGPATGDAPCDGGTRPGVCSWDHAPAATGPDTELRVLLVFTEEAVAATGFGEEAVAAHSLDAVVQLNTALSASGLSSCTAELTRTVTVSGAGSGVLEDDLRSLECWTDGKWDEVHRWRDAVDADVVVLVVAGGAGYQGWAEQFGNRDLEGGSAGFAQRGFCVVTAGAFLGKTVFVHEIGHLLGCGHNADSPGYDPCERVLPWAHAYIDAGTTEMNGFSTVMCVQSSVVPAGRNYRPKMRFSTRDLAITHSMDDGSGTPKSVATGCAPDPVDPFSGCDNADAVRTTWAHVANLRLDDGDGDSYAARCPLHCTHHAPPEPIADEELPVDLTADPDAGWGWW